MTTITTKNGTEITLDIGGTQEELMIVAEAFRVQGNDVSGTAVIQHWKHKGAEEGLFFRAHKVYVQCAAAMEQIRAAIADLPHKQYWARKVEHKIDADGDICTVETWEFDKPLQTESETFITESEMGAYLDSKNIVSIGVDDAVRMWAAEKELARITANEAGNARARAIFDDDEADAGYAQACENADIPPEVNSK